MTESLKQPLGPLMVDVHGLTLNDKDIALLSLANVGAVILFSRNFESKKQVASLIHEIKAIRSPQLLIAVDQEGGRVQRFREEFFPLPAALNYGRVYKSNPEKALDLSQSAGQLDGH